MHASFPPFSRSPEPLNQRRVAEDPELGGLKHVLLQMQDEVVGQTKVVSHWTPDRQLPAYWVITNSDDGAGPYN